MENLKQLALDAHQRFKGKLATKVKVPLKDKEALSLYYTPGVAEPCKEIERDEDLAYKYTSKGNTVAVITDGSAVLGLGNIGAVAGLPVMEGKAALFKSFADVDAVPISLGTQDTQEIITAIKAIAPGFGGINLEDISAPRCFEIEEALVRDLDIPIFHDDQHGTAIVCLAGVINALKLVEKNASDVKVIVSGAGAAGIAITKLFFEYGFKNIILNDSKGLIYEGRDNLTEIKEKMAKITNKNKIQGSLADGMIDTDIFIGVSQPGTVTKEMIGTMADKAILFAMANPIPEILPTDAKDAGAYIVATGRSDFPNQINNILVFPGLFRGVLDARARKITDDMKIAAAKALANMVDDPSPDKIIPGVFEEGVSDIVADAVKEFVTQ